MAEPYEVDEPERPAPQPASRAAPASSPAAPQPSPGRSDPAPETGIDSSTPLVVPAFPGMRVLVVLGCTLMLLAVLMSASAANSQLQHVGYTLGSAFLTLFNGILHTGTGVVAVIASAFFMKRKVGSVELAAGRMFVAFGVLLLVTAPVFPLGWVGWGLKWALALGAYWLVVRALFRKSVDETNIIAAAHLILYLLYQVGVWTSRSLGDVERDAAANAAAAAAKPALMLLGLHGA